MRGVRVVPLGFGATAPGGILVNEATWKFGAGGFDAAQLVVAEEAVVSFRNVADLRRFLEAGLEVCSQIEGRPKNESS